MQDPVLEDQENYHNLTNSNFALQRTPSCTPTRGSNGTITWQDCYELTDVVALIAPTNENVPQPFALPRNTYDILSQDHRKAISWLWFNAFNPPRGCLVADSLANNLTSITSFLNGLCITKLIFKTLIVVPSHSLEAWASALWSNCPRVPVCQYAGPNRNESLSKVLQTGGIVLSTYGVCTNDINKFCFTPCSGDPQENQRPTSPSFLISQETDLDYWDIIIFDQAERLKDPKAKTNIALAQLQSCISILLTTAEIIDNPKDLYTYFDFACEADVLCDDYGEFRSRYEHVIARANSKRADAMDIQMAEIVKSQLIDLIEPYYYRNTQALMTPEGKHMRSDVNNIPSMLGLATPVLATPAKRKNASEFNETPYKAAKNSKTGSLIVDTIPSTSKKRVKKIQRIGSPSSFDSTSLQISSEFIDLEAVEDRISSQTSNLNAALASLTASSASKTPIATNDGVRRTPISKAFLLVSPRQSPICLDAPSPRRRSFGRIQLADGAHTGNRQLEPDDFDSNITDEEFLDDFQDELDGIVPCVKRKSILEYEFTSIEAFVKKRADFSQKLYDEFNSVIFDSKLPAMDIVWRVMKNCAGLYKASYIASNSSNPQGTSKTIQVVSRSITLSKNFLTDSSRLASTLAHEMSHAAADIIDGKSREGHGPVWQKWSRIAHAHYPHIVTTSVYHTYCSAKQSEDANEISL